MKEDGQSTALWDWLFQSCRRTSRGSWSSRATRAWAKHLQAWWLSLRGQEWLFIVCACFMDEEAESRRQCTVTRADGWQLGFVRRQPSCRVRMLFYLFCFCFFCSVCFLKSFYLKILSNFQKILKNKSRKQL